jgi:DNA-binding response OmpR family regulator
LLACKQYDKFFLGVKGQMAGSDRYLSKPFKAEKLLEIVKKYILRKI